MVGRLILVASVSLILQSCIKEKKRLILRYPQISKDKKLDPVSLQYAVEYIYLDNFTQRLLELNKDGDYVPKLADSMDVSDDQLTLTFKIPNDKFADGTDITCKDIVQSFKRAILYGVPHSKPKEFILGGEKLNSFTDEIEGLTCSKNTFVLKLNQKVKEIYYYLQLTDFSIYHPTLVEKQEITSIDWHKKSSGPYYPEFRDEQLLLISNKYSNLIKSSSPKEIEVIYNKDESLEDIFKNKKYDFGNLSYQDILKSSELIKDSNLKVFANDTAGILYLVLNLKNKKFQNPSVREKIRDSIHNNLFFSDELRLKKAHQYFLPGAKGFLADLDFQDSTNKGTSSVSVSDFKVDTVKGMINYMPGGLSLMLSNSLKNKTTIDLSHDWNSFDKVVEGREFDAFIMAASMSYKVLTESLNLLYTSKPVHGTDPSGKIKTLLRDYTKSFSTLEDEEIVRNILKQMTIDAEIIPVAYYPKGRFYNTEVVDISDLFIEESMQFWRLKIK
jgi:ABC-type oligopeptide transport system substrate-binding subunit